MNTLSFAFLTVFLGILVAFSAPVNAEVGNYTLNQSNSTLVNSVANISISFTFPRAFVVCNVSIEFPSKYSIASTKVHNVTALPTGITLTTIGGQVNGQNLSFIIDSPDNVTANTSFLTLNLTEVLLPKANTTDTFSIYTAFQIPTDSGCGNYIDGAPTTFNFATLADGIVNVSVGVSQVYNGSRFVNLSGNVFNVTAFGQDTYGNTNISGGFNFVANNTNVTYFSGLGGGNGTSYTIFNATFNGTATVNVSSAISPNIPPAETGQTWNNTGINLTVVANVIVGLNFSLNSSSLVAGNQLIVAPTGFDLNGNVNNTGGFNYQGNASGMTLAGSNGSVGSNPGLFNLTRNGTLSFNVSATLNSSAWNITGPNVTVSSDVIAGVNLSYNESTIVAGGMLNLTAVGFDRFGNMNNSGGFNFSAANSTANGINYVAGNQTIYGGFNLTANGTFAFNATAFLNISAYNVSTGANITVTSNTIVGVNISSGDYPTSSNSSVSQTVNGTFNLSITGFDIYGNMNNSAGFNFVTENASVAVYESGNGTIYGVFNTTRTGTATLRVFAALNASAVNTTTANSTVHPNVTSVDTSGVTINSITISWATQETATSIVEYGLKAGYGTNVSVDGLSAVHSVPLTNLLQGTTYHYRVHTCSVFNLCSFSSDATFATNTKPSVGGGAGAGAGAGAGTGQDNESSSVEAGQLVVSGSIACAGRRLYAVVSSSSGDVEGAVVQLSSLNGSVSIPVGADGRVSFTLSDYGEYALRVSKPGFETGFDRVIYNVNSCPGSNTPLSLSGKIFCPNVFQVEALYWGNNPVSGATVTVWLREFGRVGARQGVRLISTETTGEGGLVNLTLGRPRAGIYEYAINASAEGFAPSESILVAYDASRDECISAIEGPLNVQQLQEPRPRAAASQVVDVLESVVPFELPRNESSDTVIFVIVGVVSLAVLVGLYRLVAELLSLSSK